MQSINFNDGYKEYAINGDENNVIRVNVTDINIISRMQKAMAECEESFENFSKISEPTPEQLADADREIREVIDNAFNSEISSHAFGKTNCISPVTNGKPICVAFLEAFMPMVTNEIKETMEEHTIELEAKTDKYIKPVVATSSMPEMTDEQKAFMEFLASKSNGEQK